VTIRFGSDVPDLDALLTNLRGLPGVRTANATADRIDVHGDRQSIAHVGAELVRRGTVPTDLDVELPDLEAALLHLLDTPEETTEISQTDLALAGATR